jgi:hypothetical protein
VLRRHMDLSGNALTDGYPGDFSIFAPERLTYLDISSNFFTSIPATLRTLKSLAYVARACGYMHRDLL